MRVHGALGPGFVEAVYERALAVELRRQRVPFGLQVGVPIRYAGVEVGIHRLDLLVGTTTVVELKAVATLSPAHFRVLRSYLCATRCPVGLLINFGESSLVYRRLDA